MLTDKSSVEEVKTWFKTYRNGLFSGFSIIFEGLDGLTLFAYSKEDLKAIIGPAKGIAFYNILHSPTPTGTPLNYS